jgi:cytochrome b subunit of formate dehydrogenase
LQSWNNFWALSILKKLPVLKYPVPHKSHVFGGFLLFNLLAPMALLMSLFGLPLFDRCFHFVMMASTSSVVFCLSTVPDLTVQVMIGHHWYRSFFFLLPWVQ